MVQAELVAHLVNHHCHGCVRQRRGDSAGSAGARVLPGRRIIAFDGYALHE
jgi:hypothetical protein